MSLGLITAIKEKEGQVSVSLVLDENYREVCHHTECPKDLYTLIELTPSLLASDIIHDRRLVSFVPFHG